MIASQFHRCNIIEHTDLVLKLQQKMTPIKLATNVKGKINAILVGVTLLYAGMTPIVAVFFPGYAFVILIAAPILCCIAAASPAIVNHVNKYDVVVVELNRETGIMLIQGTKHASVDNKQAPDIKEWQFPLPDKGFISDKIESGVGPIFRLNIGQNVKPLPVIIFRFFGTDQVVDIKRTIIAFLSGT